MLHASEIDNLRALEWLQPWRCMWLASVVHCLHGVERVCG